MPIHSGSNLPFPLAQNRTFSHIFFFETKLFTFSSYTIRASTAAVSLIGSTGIFSAPSSRPADSGPTVSHKLPKIVAFLDAMLNERANECDWTILQRGRAAGQVIHACLRASTRENSRIGPQPFRRAQLTGFFLIFYPALVPQWQAHARLLELGYPTSLRMATYDVQQ